MNYSSNSVLQPFTMNINAVKKLVLFNFEKSPDTIYGSLELQWLDSPKTGQGFRVIAYRTDQYVDVYDDTTLIKQTDEHFEVCGNGLKNYVYAPFTSPCCKLVEGNLHVHFSFYDYKARLIEVHLEEHATKRSIPFDLIAPIGVSSEYPTCLPVFAMYDFDLIRKRHTQFAVTIDGKAMKMDPFPVPLPKDGQMRYFMRYSCDCELIDFGSKSTKPLNLMECENSKANDGQLLAHYRKNSEQYIMESLTFCKSNHDFTMYFEKGFPDLLRMKDGTITDYFKMQLSPTMGYFSGHYTVMKKENKVTISLIPDEGWTVTPQTFIPKMMLKKDSIFRTWPKSYRYTQTINLDTLESSTSWDRLDDKSSHVTSAQDLF